MHQIPSLDQSQAAFMYTRLLGSLQQNWERTLGNPFHSPLKHAVSLGNVDPLLSTSKEVVAKEGESVRSVAMGQVAMVKKELVAGEK